MPAGPRTTPYPVVVQFSDPTTALTPTKLLESSSLYVNSLSAVTVSAGTYLNLPTVTQVTSVFQLNGTGTFETTGYSRNTYATTAQLGSYVLTSINYNLSSEVESHLASAVHWTRTELNSDYLNSSGDIANADFYLSSVSAVNLSATNYYNLPSTTLVWKEAEDIVLYVKNNSNTATIPKGTPVAIVGATGANILVEPLSSVNNHVPEAIGFSNHVAGLTQEQIIANGFGHIVVEGVIEGFDGPPNHLDTLRFTEGDWLYVSSNGQLNNVRPPAPYESHPVGIVLRSNSNNGKILVKIENVPEINDIVGFNLSKPIYNGDLIAYDLNTSTFVNTQALNISGTSKIGTVSATTYLNLPNFATTATNVTSFAGTSVFETTSYARSTYATTGQLESYALTASLGAYETTGYARNTYATTASLGAYETTSYARNTYATTGQLISYALTASLALYETTGYARNTYATTAAYATTASLGAYETTSYARNNYSVTSHNHLFSALSGLSDVMVTAAPAFAQSLVWNGSKWSPSSVTGGGGAGTPGGSNTQIQYNNNGSFGGTASLVWNNTSLLLSGTNIAALNLSAGTLSATSYQNLPNFATTANSVTSFQGTSVFETTAYARNTYATTASLASYALTASLGAYETTGYARNTYATTASLASYALTASLGAYETTSYARNNYLVTSVNVTALNGTGVFETTGYARNTYATTASLASYALTASLGAYETTAYSRNTFETTGYARNTYATTASLGAYETTAYARNNYVLTSINSNLSSTVTGHIASAVHWDLPTLNSYYINASGDSVTGAFTFGSVTATNVSATNYFNLPSGTPIWNANLLSGVPLTYNGPLGLAPLAPLDILVYTNVGDFTNFKWTNITPAIWAGTAGAVFPANKLQNTDVTATVPTAGQVLAYDGTNSRWTPSSAPFGTGGGSPGGNDYEIQFKNGASFSGVSQGKWVPGGSTFQFVSVYADYYNGDFGSLNKDNGLRSTAVSATNYYNLPSGIAIWNASSIRDYAVVTGTPTNGDMLYFSSTQWKRRQFTYGTAAPTGGSDGDIYLQYT